VRAEDCSFDSSDPCLTNDAMRLLTQIESTGNHKTDHAKVENFEGYRFLSGSRHAEHPHDQTVVHTVGYSNPHY